MTQKRPTSYINKINFTFLAVFFLGILLDFITNGVLKITWTGVFCIIYFALAVNLYNYFQHGDLHRYSIPLAFTLVVGATLGHLFFTQKPHLQNFEMTRVSDSPLTLQSPDFSDRLIIVSEKLQAALASKGEPQKVSVSIQVVKGYGCIESFKVDSIEGVDLASDTASQWVWKSVPGALAPRLNPYRYWCWIRWY
jgi:hypothetical protein